MTLKNCLKEMFLVIDQAKIGVRNELAFELFLCTKVV